jgi:hypothetical protein
MLRLSSARTVNDTKPIALSAVEGCAQSPRSNVLTGKGLSAFRPKSPLPLPSTGLRACFSKEGLHSFGENPPLKKRGTEGDLSATPALRSKKFLNELLRHHTI